MKAFIFAVVFLIVALQVQARDLTSAISVRTEQEYFQALQDPFVSTVIIDSEQSPEMTLLNVAEQKKAYDKAYPKGDFYYFIGGLSNPWSEADYGRFYKVAKKLTEKGFRTIINVRAFIPEVKEAVINQNTSAIIWNSHGSEDGVVYDSGEKALPKNIFTKDRSPRLKFVMFANCYGSVSKFQYELIRSKDIYVMAWHGEVDSDMFFKYLNSKKFEEALP